MVKWIVKRIKNFKDFGALCISQHMTVIACVKINKKIQISEPCTIRVWGGVTGIPQI